MNDPWFDPNAWAWLPGTLFGGLCGIWGAVVGILAPQGKGRRFVLGYSVVLIAASAGCLAAGLTALWARQPWGIWFAFLVPGIQGIVLVVSFQALIAKRYREAEERRMSAVDLD